MSVGRVVVSAVAALLGAFMAIDCGRRSGCCQGGEGAGAARAMENEP